MRSVTVLAPAKLNLTLDVTGTRPDGYHTLDMIMQAVSLRERVTLRRSRGLSLSLPGSRVPANEHNTAYKAALAFFHGTGLLAGAAITVEKHVPVRAGMAGGSADAAAVLRGMNELFERRVSDARLEEIAGDVGSDVPFCVRGGTVLAEGRGEVLSPLPPLPECVFVICKPDFSISTPELFKKLDMVRSHHHPDTAGIVAALKTRDLPQLCRRMYNVFENVDDRRMKAVAEIKSALLDRGALGAVMTGTGSAVFGIYGSESAAAAACDALKEVYGFCCTAKPV